MEGTAVATALDYRITMQATGAGTASASGVRLDAIDLLRGLVMAVMVLDHARDFFMAGGFNPRDVHDPALFLTRWITHFCAPVFVFLAGMSAFLHGARGRTRGELSLYLLSRGLWLVLLEVTLVRFAWTFSIVPDFILLQVIWAIGMAMVALAGLVHLPRRAIAAIALAMIAGHNLLDGVDAARLGSLGWVWNVLHQPATLHPTPGLTVFPLYPLIPWVGVMALGYVLGPVMQAQPATRRRTLLLLGAAATLGFVLLRASNLYGDPAPWKVEDGLLPTVLSLVNCEKYPPSLLYLAMTLGPAMMALALLDRVRAGVGQPLLVFGRVPLLFYVAHILLLHAGAVVLALASTAEAAWLFGGLPIVSVPAGYGLGLPGAYLVWLLALALLYPPCRWFAGLKRRRGDWWLSYL